MKTRNILDKELLVGDSTLSQSDHVSLLEKYRVLADSYARLENVIAVLSDMHTNESYIYYGDFCKILALDTNTGHLPSIWEDAIFSLMHPDDLNDKLLQELCFYNFVKRQPKELRKDFFLMSKLRMLTSTGKYISVLHRMFYIYAPGDSHPWLALCLYGVLANEFPARCIALNSATGKIIKLDKHKEEKILSAREKQVLALINRGLTSKEIAASLFISVNTVSRHRQDILAKLRVKNSVEACQVANRMGVIPHT